MTEGENNEAETPVAAISSVTLPCTPSGAALRLAGRFSHREPGEPSVGELFAMMIYEDAPVEAGAKSSGMWLGFFFWLVGFAVMLALFIGAAWLTDSAEAVTLVFKATLGALFGLTALWGVRWSIAVSQQRKLGEDAMVTRVPRGWPEWPSMVAGTVLFLLLLP